MTLRDKELLKIRSDINKISLDKAVNNVHETLKLIELRDRFGFEALEEELESRNISVAGFRNRSSLVKYYILRVGITAQEFDKIGQTKLVNLKPLLTKMLPIEAKQKLHDLLQLSPKHLAQEVKSLTNKGTGIKNIPTGDGKKMVHAPINKLSSIKIIDEQNSIGYKITPEEVVQGKPFETFPLT